MKILPIRILTQNVKDIDGMNKGLTQVQSLLSNIGLNITFTFKDTQRQFTSVPLNTDVVYQGYQINPQEIIDETPETTGVTCLIYDWSTIFPHPTNPCTQTQKGEIPIQLPIQFYTDTTVTPNITYPDVLCQFFLHELSHTIAYLTSSTDLTHFQYKSMLNNSSPTNYYLYLIKSLISLLPDQTTTMPTSSTNVVPSSPQSPTVTMTRFRSNIHETLGNLVAQNNGMTFTCKTLELADHNNLPNISCIPKGRYQVKWSHTLRFPFGVYQIQNVPNRSGIDIHSANFYSQLEGCIALGQDLVDVNSDTELDTTNSKATLKAFQDFMGKKDFILTIV